MIDGLHLVVLVSLSTRYRPIIVENDIKLAKGESEGPGGGLRQIALFVGQSEGFRGHLGASHDL
jgi:hypothetical protein